MNTIKKILIEFNNAIQEIESLNDYYQRSNKTLISYRLEIDKKRSIGKKVADILDGLFNIVGAEERNKKIEDIKNIILENDIKFCDVFEILPFEKENQTFISFSVNQEFIEYDKYDPKKAKEKYEHINRYSYIFYESILSHIIVSFETFLASIYRILLLSNPQKYFENQTIPLAVLFSQDVSETINEKIESEVNSKMYDSLSAIKYIAEKEKIPLDGYKTLSESFKELYYRRNAFIHTKGKVNKDYLSKVDKNLTKNLKIDDDLVCDSIYLENAICMLNQIVFSITFEILKIQKATDNAITVVSNYYFEKLCEGEYKLCKYVFLCLSNYSQLPFIDRLVYRINFIIAAKQLKEIGLVKHELDELDVTAAESRFKIAKECLRENYENAYKMLNETYPQSFRAIDIKEWPIFIDFRETEYYKLFVDAHKSDFAIQIIDDNESEIDNLINVENLSAAK